MRSSSILTRASRLAIVFLAVCLAGNTSRACAQEQSDSDDWKPRGVESLRPQTPTEPFADFLNQQHRDLPPLQQQATADETPPRSTVPDPRSHAGVLLP